jgi:hypothetical protein
MQPACAHVNDARYNLFKLRLGRIDDALLPPTHDSLMMHFHRANYQAAIFRRCLQQSMKVPSPDGHGWLVKDTAIEIGLHWMIMPVATDDVQQFLHCRCSKSACKSGNCSCVKANLLCTDMCQCTSCCNGETTMMQNKITVICQLMKVMWTEYHLSYWILKHKSCFMLTLCCLTSVQRQSKTIELPLS